MSQVFYRKTCLASIMSSSPTISKMNSIPQIAGTLVVSLASVSLGTALGYPTKALPQMATETNLAVQLNQYEGSWFAALFWISGIVFSPLGGALSGHLGRKRVILVTSPLVALGWLVIGLATNKTMLYIGRAMTAIFLRLHMSSVGVYISETVHPKIRGTLVILPAFFMACGMLTVWILGYFFTWRTTAFLVMIPMVVLFIGLIPLPESPYWLVEDGKHSLAKKSLQFFRGEAYDITEEMNEIVEKSESKKLYNSSSTLKRMTSSAFLKPFSSIGTLYLLGSWTGFNSILVYMHTILKESGTIDEGLGPIYVGIVRVLFAGISPFVVKHLNPKWLFVTCQCISTLAMSTIGTYVYLQAFHPDLPYLSTFSWIPLAMIVIIVIMRASGILPISHILMNELYPTEIRTQSIGVTQSIFLLSGSFGVKLFPELKDALGMYGLCFLYTLVGFLSALWGFLTIPDNRGKSLVKVEEMYENK